MVPKITLLLLLSLLVEGKRHLLSYSCRIVLFFFNFLFFRGNIPDPNDLLSKNDIVRLKRCIFAEGASSMPPITTHNIGKSIFCFFHWTSSTKKGFWVTHRRPHCSKSKKVLHKIVTPQFQHYPSICS